MLNQYLMGDNWEVAVSLNEIMTIREIHPVQGREKKYMNLKVGLIFSLSQNKKCLQHTVKRRSFYQSGITQTHSHNNSVNSPFVNQC